MGIVTQSPALSGSCISNSSNLFAKETPGTSNSALYPSLVTLASSTSLLAQAGSSVLFLSETFPASTRTFAPLRMITYLFAMKYGKIADFPRLARGFRHFYSAFGRGRLPSSRTPSGSYNARLPDFRRTWHRTWQNFAQNCFCELSNAILHTGIAGKSKNRLELKYERFFGISHFQHEMQHRA